MTEVSVKKPRYIRWKCLYRHVNGTADWTLQWKQHLSASQDFTTEVANQTYKWADTGRLVTSGGAKPVEKMHAVPWGNVTYVAAELCTDDE